MNNAGEPNKSRHTWSGVLANISSGVVVLIAPSRLSRQTSPLEPSLAKKFVGEAFSSVNADLAQAVRNCQLLLSLALMPQQLT